jgi:exosortase/archaeosortase family protein
VNRQIAHAFVRLASTVLVTVGGFYLLQERWRKAELRIVVDVVSTFGVHRANHVYGTSVLVAPQHAAPFLAEVTPSCSALGALLAFSAIALFLVPGSVSRRAVAAGVASALVVIANVVRIALSLGVGVRFGSHAMVVVHDWIGTLIGLFAVLAGFTAFMFLLLPKSGSFWGENVGS